MSHQKFIPIQEYETSTKENEYQYLCIKVDEIEGDNITD